MTTSPQQPPPGLTVGGYELLTRLGEGGMGVVHLARRPGGQRVALKVLRPHIVGDDEARRRLEREVGSLSRIRSRWVAEIVDADPWGPVPYVATRYVPGLSLHDLVQEDGPVTGEDLWWLARCLVEGVASVHAVGVLHRDVKPSNVLMEGRTPILIDFGLARVADDPKLTHTGWLLGTPGYLAPEILHGQDATTAADVHSWAATVAYAGTGDPPFGRGPSMAVMDRVRRGEHRLDGLPPGLREIVAAALDPDPRQRPTTAVLGQWLNRGSPRPVAPAHDEFTLPLALASAAHESTEVVPGVASAEPLRPPTRLLTGGWPQEAPADAAADPWAEPWPPPAERVPAVERARRVSLLGATAALVGAAVIAFPWVALAVLMVLCWLLRSASLAASATGDRRRLRGVRWYDPAIYLVGAPWHAVRALPGTFLLAAWSLGLGLAAALLCYAVATDATTTLGWVGLTVAVSLWLGPGGSRVRSPLRRVVNPVSADTGTWAAALLVLVVAAGFLLWWAGQSGTTWTPADGPPLSSLHCPERPLVARSSTSDGPVLGDPGGEPLALRPAGAGRGGAAGGVEHVAADRLERGAVGGDDEAVGRAGALELGRHPVLRADRAHQRRHRDHDVAAGGQVGVRGRAHAAVDVGPPGDLDRRPHQRHGAARGDRVQQVDARVALEDGERARVGVDRRDPQVAVGPRERYAVVVQPRLDDRDPLRTRARVGLARGLPDPAAAGAPVAGEQQQRGQAERGPQAVGGADLVVGRGELLVVPLVEVDPAGHLGADDGTRGRADHRVGRGQVEPVRAQGGQHAELPRDAGDPAAAEH